MEHTNKCTYRFFYNLKFTFKHLKHSYIKEQSKLPEDDYMIETCRSILSVLM